MKPTRPARGARPLPVRIAGYGGSALLVVAAVVVLLTPLASGGGGAGASGARDTSAPGAAPADDRAAPPGGPVTATAPAAPRTGAGRTRSGGSGAGEGQGGRDGGPPMPGGTGSGPGLTWCPQGTAYYRAADQGVDVVIGVASSGAVKAEVAIRGHAPQARQATVRGGRPYTFHFTGVPPRLVERVKVMTLSVGVAMQTCYAQPA